MDNTKEMAGEAIRYLATKWSKLKVSYSSLILKMFLGRLIAYHLLQLTYVYEIEMSAGGANGEYAPIKNYENTTYLSFNGNCKVIEAVVVQESVTCISCNNFCFLQFVEKGPVILGIPRVPMLPIQSLFNKVPNTDKMISKCLPSHIYFNYFCS